MLGPAACYGHVCLSCNTSGVFVDFLLCSIVGILARSGMHGWNGQDDQDVPLETSDGVQCDF